MYKIDKASTKAKHEKLSKKLDQARRKKEDAAAAEKAVLAELNEIEKDMRIIELEERLAQLEGNATGSGDAL